MLSTAQVHHFRTVGFVVRPAMSSPRPETDEEPERTLRSMADGFEQAHRGFDRHRYPAWPDWLADAASHPNPAQIAEHLRPGGVLDLPGVEIGW